MRGALLLGATDVAFRTDIGEVTMRKCSPPSFFYRESPSPPLVGDALLKPASMGRVVSFFF